MLCGFLFVSFLAPAMQYITFTAVILNGLVERTSVNIFL
ncbi:Uncharacterised protein [Lederbergia lenta]|uniref:Uncharacterized protein n=1 Tax=Lederbergia lenta TaxID=1467 RepID=A0A2X4WL76_LEDLE|nr:Uncharacterised protein [Lederbergia lenta]